MISENDIISRVEESYASHPGYRHKFWDWFAAGGFDLPLLQKFALLYYEHVKIFRLYLAGAMTVMPSEDLQIALAEIIGDEFGIAAHEPSEPAASHPELFRQFMRSIGLTENEWEGNRPIRGIKHFRDVHYALFRGELVDETLGAITFGCERTTPFRHGKVVSGVRKFMQSQSIPVNVTFFSAHQEIDPHHSGSLIAAMSRLSKNGSLSIERVIAGARMSFDARKVFLDDLAKSLGIQL